jgi:hypothetical protein
MRWKLGHMCQYIGIWTSETVVCIEGCMDWVFYKRLPGVDTGGPVHNGVTAADESCFVEAAKFRVCPREGQYGIQVPFTVV